MKLNKLLSTCPPFELTVLTSGQFAIVAAEVFVPGMACGEVLTFGMACGEVFIPGMTAGEVEPE